MKINGKVRFALAIFAVLVVIIYFFIDNKSVYDDKVQQNNSEKIDSEKPKENDNTINNKNIKGKDTSVLEFTEKFVDESFSDFTDGTLKYSKYLDGDATALFEFINDRTEIIEFKQSSVNRELKLSEYNTVESEIIEIETDLYEVKLNRMYYFLDGETESGMEVLYKILVHTSPDMRVLAAMSSDLSSTPLIGLVKSYDDLNYNYQLEANGVKPYDLEEVKSELLEFYKTLE